MRLALPLTVILPMALLTLGRAQGTRADYARANSLGQRVNGKVFRASVRPNWIAGTDRFWYRNDLAGGQREFILVDSAGPMRKPAFDHARLAAGLSKVLGRDVSAERLPVDRIAFVADRPVMLVQIQEKSYACDLNTYEVKPSTETLGRAQAIPPEDMPRGSVNGTEATLLTFLNSSKSDLTLWWVDTEGQRRAYDTLSPGATSVHPTYVGHLWLATAKSGKPLAAFVGREMPLLAVIDGQAKRTVSAATERRSAPERKWSAFVKSNNVFLREAGSGAETQLTQDGSAQDAYEGEPRWSPDGSKFVLFKTVPAQEHKVYFVESSPRDQVQPKLHSTDYLKPGDRIAHSRPHLFDPAARRDIPISDDLFLNPWEISRLQWQPDGKRFTFLYNQRGHLIMRLIAVDAETGKAVTVIEETQKTFIDWNYKVYLHQMEASHEAIWMSERDGWNHLYLYDTATGKVKSQITKGDWVVRGVDRVDEKKRQIWFRAGGIRPGQDPYYVHFCRVNFDGTGLNVLTEGDGNHSISWSPDNAYFVDTYSRVDMPPVTELRRSDSGKKVIDLERGDASALLATGWRYPERFVSKGRDGATDIYGVIMRPSNFDSKRKYPVIEDIYAGPQGSFVPKSFTPGSGLQQMAELGFIVVQIDGMGTNDRSKAFHDVCWKNLGDAGFPDRMLWIKAAGAKYPYMDLTRVGIYGGSAGGQNALGGLLQHGDFYKVGVADCGCHDNRMDKIWWNEQWMGWPVGPHYAEQSNVTLAHKLQGKLLLMVGEMDTNVDPASTMQVVDALIKADKDFELLVSPGTGHGVAGTPYGRRRLQDFFVKNLLGVEPRSQPALAAVDGPQKP